jgi:hypothetical protein
MKPILDYKKRVPQKINQQQQYDRYVAMGREAMLSGDRVSAENYYQYAEHFFRVLNEKSLRYAVSDSGLNRSDPPRNDSLNQTKSSSI